MEDENTDNGEEEVYSDDFSDSEDESSEVISDSENDSDALMRFKQGNARQIIYDSESSASELESDTRSTIWMKIDSKRKLEPFLGDPGIKIFPNDPQSISKVAELFIGDDLIDLVANETNKYYFQMCHRYKSQTKSKKWTDTTVAEIKKFLALNILMGQVRKSKIDDYWSTDPVIATPFFSMIMTRNRFQQILRFLHFYSNANIQQNADRLCKIQPVMNYFVNKFDSVYKPEQELFLDESMIPYRERHSFQVCSSHKLRKHGILARILCEANTGYICSFKLYCGTMDNLENTILALLNENVNSGHHVYMDNYQNTVAVVENLLARNVRVCGTIIKSKGFPKELRNLKLKVGESDFRRKGEILALVWKHRREVRILSTIHNADIVESGKVNRKTGKVIRKPECIVKYNHLMKGVNLTDQYLSYYSYLRKSVKWTKKTFMFLVHCALFNSFIIYRKLNPNIKITFSKYMQTLAKEWIAGDNKEYDNEDPGNSPTSSAIQRTPRHDPPHRLSADIKTHYLEKIRSPGTKKCPQKRCRVCNAHGKRSDTSFMCKSCRIPLCKGHCFKIYHTSKKY